MATRRLGQRTCDLDDKTVRTLRSEGLRELAAQARQRGSASLDPDALTIGFARRFATYKRATLLLRDLDRLNDLLTNNARPIQFVFAGKAHPADIPGKELLPRDRHVQPVADFSGTFRFYPRLRHSGGTSHVRGMRCLAQQPDSPPRSLRNQRRESALNGGLNFSISDGWWDEMADGQNGWVIPSSDEADPSERDNAEAAAIFNLLESQIVPEFFADAEPCSRLWIERMRHAWRTLGTQVTAGRMVSEYERKLYRPALDEVRQL